MSLSHLLYDMATFIFGDLMLNKMGLSLVPQPNKTFKKMANLVIDHYNK